MQFCKYHSLTRIILRNLKVKLDQVINFTVITYEQMNDNCINANTWSFYSTFLFVGSVATTIGKLIRKK